MQVVLDAPLHFPHSVGRAAVAVHLRPSCDAGFHSQPFVVASDYRTVEERMRWHVRSRPYERHLTEEHVDELRQLVQGGAPQEASYTSDSGVYSTYGIIVRFHLHSPEFVASK